MLLVIFYSNYIPLFYVISEIWLFIGWKSHFFVPNFWCHSWGYLIWILSWCLVWEIIVMVLLCRERNFMIIFQHSVQVCQSARHLRTAKWNCFSVYDTCVASHSEKCCIGLL